MYLSSSVGTPPASLRCLDVLSLRLPTHNRRPLLSHTNLFHPQKPPHPQRQPYHVSPPIFSPLIYGNLSHITHNRLSPKEGLRKIHTTRIFFQFKLLLIQRKAFPAQPWTISHQSIWTIFMFLKICLLAKPLVNMIILLKKIFWAENHGFICYHQIQVIHKLSYLASFDMLTT